MTRKTSASTAPRVLAEKKSCTSEVQQEGDTVEHRAQAVPAQEMQCSWWTFPTATHGNGLQNKWGCELWELEKFQLENQKKILPEG